jgi:hypothetical protein
LRLSPKFFVLQKVRYVKPSGSADGTESLKLWSLISPCNGLYKERIRYNIANPIMSFLENKWTGPKNEFVLLQHGIKTKRLPAVSPYVCFNLKNYLIDFNTVF